MKIFFWMSGLALAVTVPLTSMAQVVQHAPGVEALAVDYAAQGTTGSGSQAHDELQSDSNLNSVGAALKRSYGSDAPGAIQAGRPREMTVSTYSAPIRVIGR
ncbi:hypothetical protein C2L65_35545 [Paraburkholderia terrae]|jgi:hypothetical protein|uniref:DUF4148 domain-containing protein n=1 Tax=Paraburkholderia terrae TaxID=311230 RepID=A0A2I8EZP1_9BURK|nr:hypothetical protein C2L65_35545 [Paraburkholderia terrae]